MICGEDLSDSFTKKLMTGKKNQVVVEYAQNLQCYEKTKRLHFRTCAVYRQKL